MQSSTQNKSHLLFLDGLRAVAAVYVATYHAAFEYFDFHHFSNLSTIKKTIIQFFQFGHYAVDMFIALSGFSLMLSVTKNEGRLKGGIYSFLKRRVVRILPPYYFAMFISLLMIWLLLDIHTGTPWDNSLPVTLNSIVTHVFLIHDFFHSTMFRINPAFWSISVECRIYLFFPLLIWIFRRFGPLVALSMSCIIAVSGVFILILLHRYNPDVYLNLVGVSPLIVLFTCGMIAADVSFSNKNFAVVFRKRFFNAPVKSILFYGAVLSVGYIILRLVVKHPFFSHKNVDRNLAVDVDDVFFGMVFSFLLFFLSTVEQNNRKIWILKLLQSKLLVFIGTFSYSVYLIHEPLLQIATQYILLPMHISAFTSSMLLIFAFMPLIILVSYLFFIVFEKPFLTLGKPKTSQKQ